MTKIVSTDDVLGGAPRIEGRRIGVHHVARRVLDAGLSPEQVATELDLDLADVHRAMTYYYDHPAEMRAVTAERRNVPPDVEIVAGPEDLQDIDEAEPSP